MKHLKSIIVIASFVISLTLNAQDNLSGIIHYESTISKKAKDNYLKKRDSLSKLQKGDFMIQGMDAVFLNTTPTLSTIEFNNGEGLYKVESSLNIDETDFGQKIARTSAGGSNEYYYNTKEDKYLIKNCETTGDCFIYPNPNLEWNLTQESKIINGYTAFKATRSEGKVIAWYAPALPLNFGPKGEYGLPGLILELDLGKTTFKVTKIELNPKKKVKVKAPTKGKAVTYEEYVEIIEKAKHKIFGKN